MRRAIAAVVVAAAVLGAAACGGDDSSGEATSAPTTAVEAAGEDAPRMTADEVSEFAAGATVGEWQALSTENQLLVAERWIAVEKSEMSPPEVIGATVIEAQVTDPSVSFRDMMVSIQETLEVDGGGDQGEPDVSYKYVCNYLLGDHSESTSGYRFVADVTLENDGNVGALNRVTAIWDQIGGDPVKSTKTVRVAAGGKKKVSFTQVATSDQIDRHQGAGSTCDVRANTFDTFGPVR